MGQRHQIYIVVKNREVKTEQDKQTFGTKETTVFAYHHQWLYGRSALFMAGKVMEMVNAEHGPYGEDNTLGTTLKLHDFTRSLLSIDLKYNGGIKGVGYNWIHPLLTESYNPNWAESYRNYIDRGDNNDGITIIDTINKKYCFMHLDQYHDVKAYIPLSAQEYIDTYYKNPEIGVKRFINLAVKYCKWDVLTLPELAKLFPLQKEFQAKKKVKPAVIVPQLTEYQKAITILENDKCRFEVDFNSKSLICYDLLDKWNETKGFNRTSRSIKKAWSALVESWTETTSMYGGCGILGKNGIRMHTYCGID